MLKNHEDKFPAFEEKHLAVKCKHCDKRFYSKEALRKHERKVHKIFKTEKLPNGKYKSAKPRSISLRDNLPFNSLRKCEKCEQSFKNLNIFSDHMKQHELGRNLYKCEHCSKAFYRRS